MATFTKIYRAPEPEIVEAIRFTGTNGDEVQDFIGVINPIELTPLLLGGWVVRRKVEGGKRMVVEVLDDQAFTWEYAPMPYPNVYVGLSLSEMVRPHNQKPGVRATK